MDQHIKGLTAMGALIDVEHGDIVARLPQGQQRLRGARITTDMITVTGTENLMMAACLAEGETVLENAAQEPEIADLAEMLIAMGAHIEGHGSSSIRIQGVDKLHGCTHQVVADRIGKHLCLRGGRHGRRCAAHPCAHRPPGGAGGQAAQRRCHRHRPARRHARAKPGGARLVAQGFRTMEYPGFPTDMQAQFMAFNLVAQGTTTVTETIFENRYMHVQELMRLGAEIMVDGRVATVAGGAHLTGATVMATDLRASASLVIAGLVAEGETTVDRIYHLDRGYDAMEDKLRQLGADIERIQ